jgi:hypothetical protein
MKAGSRQQLQRQSQPRFAATSGLAVFEHRHSAVPLGDLAAERQADTWLEQLKLLNLTVKEVARRMSR